MQLGRGVRTHDGWIDLRSYAPTTYVVGATSDACCVVLAVYSRRFLKLQNE